MMKYSDKFIEETLKENVELRMKYFEYKEKAKKSEEYYYNYRHQLAKEARNKNKEQVLRERDILQQRISKAIDYIENNDIMKVSKEKDTKGSTFCDTELLDILKGVGK